MKKKIMFMLINMNIGGTEKALLNMIAEMPRDQYEITIMLLEPRGAFLEMIPAYIQIEYLKGYSHIKEFLNKPLHLIAWKLLKAGKALAVISALYLYFLLRVLNNKNAFFKSVLRQYPAVGTDYDIAVAYAGPMDFISYYVVHKIKSKKKIQWIHFDITRIGFDNRFASKTYKDFDKVFVVSEEGRSKLLQAIPRLKHKVETFKNMISRDLILSLAEEEIGFEDGFNGIRILTVGRLSKEKGQDLTIPVLERLIENGYNVRWYCVGEGVARAQYEHMIQQYQLENDYILLGARINPYPFMKECDIYVQPSRHEGYCITLAEALCFDNPIISTDFTGAREQITHEQSGLIVNFDEDQMYQAVRRLLDDEILKMRLKKTEDIKTTDKTYQLEKLYV